jgi:hypothetical protein
MLVGQQQAADLLELGFVGSGVGLLDDFTLRRDGEVVRDGAPVHLRSAGPFEAVGTTAG